MTLSVCPAPKCVQKYHEVITFQELTDCLPTLTEELIMWHIVQAACPVGVSSAVVGNMKVCCNPRTDTSERLCSADTA